MFPRVIAAIIADYAKVPRLLPWIDADGKATCVNIFDKRILICDSPHLWSNPLAYEAGLLDMDEIYKNVGYAAKNPALANFIKNNFYLFKHSDNIWENEALYDWLIEQNINFPSFIVFSNNNKRHILRHIHLLNEFVVSAGGNGVNFLTLPNAWPYFAHRVTFDKEIRFNSVTRHTEYLFANPCAIELIKKATEHDITFLQFCYLSQNPHPWAIEYCRHSGRLIHIHNFSANPGIFTYEDGGELEKHLMELQ